MKSKKSKSNQTGLPIRHSEDSNPKSFLERHATIITVWGSIATMIGVLLTIYTIIIPSYRDKITNTSETNASISNSITSNNNVIYHVYDSEEEKSIAEQLYSAESLYLQGKYDAADEIYTSLLDKSDVANINHGYFYAYGYSVSQNTDKASEYYLKAYEMGNELGLRNYIAINLYHPISYKSTLNALKYGYDHDDETAISFLSICNYGNLQNVSKEQLKIIAEDFLKLPYEKQVEKLQELKMNTYFEIICVDDKESPVNGEFVSYRQIDVKWGKRTVINYITQVDENTNEVIVPVNSYDKFTTYCKTSSSFYMAEYYEPDLFCTM